MTASTFDGALRRLLAHEGGYSNHPSDPGGPTNFGVTIADYRRYAKPGATAADVRTMRRDEAAAIYRARYWNAVRCDELPSGLDYAAFDYAVNSGTGRAIKVMQRLLGLPADGRMTDMVLAAVRKRDVRDLIARLCDERLAFLKRLKTWPVFGTGWSRRVSDVRAAALAMASAQPIQASDAMTAPGKGLVPLNTTAQRTSAGAIAAAGAAAAQQAHQSGARLTIVVAVAVIAIALAAGCFLAWRWHQCRQ